MALQEPPLAEGWQELAIAASHERDVVNLRLLINQLILALAQEQLQLRAEIQARLNYRASAFDSSGIQREGKYP